MGAEACAYCFFALPAAALPAGGFILNFEGEFAVVFFCLPILGVFAVIRSSITKTSMRPPTASSAARIRYDDKYAHLATVMAWFAANQRTVDVRF
jgi:hypothetical protein